MEANLEFKKIETYQSYFESAISYSQYLDNFNAEINLGDESPYAQYLPQNYQRQSRLDRKFKLREDVLDVLRSNQKRINWLVITEHWCGDASQINPVVNRFAEESGGNINLKFIYRDKNEALIDAHLTDGRSRSIPIILSLDEDYKFLKSYGPRPSEAQQLVKSFLSKGESYNIPLHTWYAKNKQQDLQDDLMKFIQVQ